MSYLFENISFYRKPWSRRQFGVFVVDATWSVVTAVTQLFLLE